jgi:hypothetical protein
MDSVSFRFFRGQIFASKDREAIPERTRTNLAELLTGSPFAFKANPQGLSVSCASVSECASATDTWLPNSGHGQSEAAVSFSISKVVGWNKRSAVPAKRIDRGSQSPELRRACSSLQKSHSLEGREP